MNLIILINMEYAAFLILIISFGNLYFSRSFISSKCSATLALSCSQYPRIPVSVGPIAVCSFTFLKSVVCAFFTFFWSVSPRVSWLLLLLSIVYVFLTSIIPALNLISFFLFSLSFIWYSFPIIWHRCCAHWLFQVSFFIYNICI